MKIVIVDDEHLARERIKALIQELGGEFTICGEAENGKQALQIIPKLNPDVVFLDIQMPVLDGFDVVSLLPEPKPAFLFITAYDEYAIKAFEVNAIDYLMKPVRKERLENALDRVKKQTSDQIAKLISSQPVKKLQKLPVLHKNEILLLDLDEIIWIEAQGPVIFAHTSDKSYRTDFKLEDIETRLSKQNFIRIHRSYIVHVEKIKKLIPWFNNNFRVEMKNGKVLDIARRRLKNLKATLGV